MLPKSLSTAWYLNQTEVQNKQLATEGAEENISASFKHIQMALRVKSPISSLSKCELPTDVLWKWKVAVNRIPVCILARGLALDCVKTLSAVQ